MLNKIQSLLDSTAISEDCRSVLKLAQVQTSLLQVLDKGIDEHPVFKRFIQEYDVFFKDCLDYPFSRYCESVSTGDVTQIISKEDDVSDYSFRVFCHFTWKCGDWDQEHHSVDFKASWLLASETESPWLGNWVDQKISETIRMFKSYYPEKTIEDQLNMLASHIGVSKYTLEEWLKGNLNPKIDRLHNLHLYSVVANSSEWKKIIKEQYPYLVNSSYEFDPTDKEDGTTSLSSYLTSHHRLSRDELQKLLLEIEKQDKEEKAAQAEYETYKKLEEKFKKDKV